jgi:predicted N-formylglutamate amidohydrolase
MMKKQEKQKKKTQKPARTPAKKAPKPASAPLLTRGEPAPFRIENPRGAAPCLIVCDHASNRVPKALGGMGIAKKDLQKHIAWDPGTEEIGRQLSRMLGAPAVLASYSRLVVDLNRGPNSPECMRKVYDHIDIPANRGLSAAQRKARLETFFWPYHAEVDKRIQGFLAKGIVPVIISLHSFTPEIDGFKRPWHIGVLWNKEAGIARQLVENLRARNPRMKVGENEPYSLKAKNVVKNTISTHAESRGLPYVIVEFRQDLVSTKAGARKWARLFLESLAPILVDPAIYCVRPYHPLSKKKGNAKRRKTAGRRKTVVRKTVRGKGF